MSATMTRVTDLETAEPSAQDPAPAPARADSDYLVSFVVAIVVGAGLVLGARAGAVELLVAVAVVQALFVLTWVFGTAMPGKWGGLIIGALASAGADVAVMLRPHDRLGPLLVVVGLVIPVIFIHQLSRGAARVQVVASMSAVALLAWSVVSLSAVLQVRHEFLPSEVGGKVAATALAAVAGALAVGFLVDLVVPAPRFDAEVPRGLVAVLASTAVGGALGYLMLDHVHQLPAPRATFAGAALGALAALVAVAAAFVLHTVPAPGSTLVARIRPAISAMLSILLLSPVAFLLFLAIRI